MSLAKKSPELCITWSWYSKARGQARMRQVLTLGSGGKQVFVAGATGRLGARIVKMLLEKNNQIKVRPAYAVRCLASV